MARPQTSPILAQLRSAKTVPEQTAALQALKNEVAGHVQRKETWVGLGVLEPIVATLSQSRPSARLNGKDTRSQLVLRPLSEEAGVKLQALQLVASFANGGPAFLPPLYSAGALPAVLAHISPFTCAPQIVTAALKALSAIADAAELAPPSCPIDIDTLADQTFTPQHLEAFNAMLSTSSSKLLLQSQLTLTAGLIRCLCREDRHQQALTAAGVLDSLATRLASFAVRDGHIIPGAYTLAQDDGLSEAFPDPAPANATPAPVLDAIATILGASKYRAHKLLNSPSILAVFPAVRFDPPRGFLDPRGDLDVAGLGLPHHHDFTAMEYLLPAVPITMSRAPSASQSSFQTPERLESRASSRTSLNRFGPSPAFDTSNLQSLNRNSESEPENIESPLIPWLILLVRTPRECDRLMAASVLAALFKAGLGIRIQRESSLGLLVVPILVDMVARIEQATDSLGDSDSALERMILERAPATLARLTADSEYLSRAAFECNAVKTLSKLLRYAYSPVDAKAVSFWSPEPDTGMDVEGHSPVSQLGEVGMDPSLGHRIKLRESALKAIGALAASKEDYRKALINEEIAACVVESLLEFPRKPWQSKERKEKVATEAIQSSPSAQYGTNPLSVIIAACHVVRILARSPSILRTSLVDYGAAWPIFQLMKHSNINVQIASTSSIINLVLEVSPVRELLIENGVMGVLCEHAHSDNPALRLNALWALKHLVDAVGPELKKACLEQLGPGWLVQLICDDPHETALHNARMKESSGEDLDEDMDMQPTEDPIRWAYWSNGSLRELDAMNSSRLRQAEDRLSAARDAELSPVRKARNDAVAIQEQGLDFIRNLIGTPGTGPTSESTSDTTDLIDFLFSELGQDRLFEIMTSKLRAKVLNPFARRSMSATREARVLHPQSKVIVAVIYILVHIAASVSRHRQLVIAQTELLRLLSQQASSKDKEVRVALCHLITNLTSKDDESEAQECAQRAHELKRLGFHSKMETLRQQDRDLDVKERAKTAVWQIEQALY